MAIEFPESPNIGDIFILGNKKWICEDILVPEGPLWKAIIPSTMRGFTGEKGDTGPDGKSAYQVAVDNGFTGTESE